MRKAKTRQMVDTYELCVYAEEKYGMGNSEWHDKVWHGEGGGDYGLCDYIMEGPVTFEVTKNPKTERERQVNDFLSDNPELKGKVTFFFDD